MKRFLSLLLILSVLVAYAQAQPTLKPYSPIELHVGMASPYLCFGSAPVRVLAVENQYGPGGSTIPTRIDYKVNDNPYLPAFGGNEVSPGQWQYLPVGSTGGEPAVLTLKGKMAYPDFDLPEVSEEHPSTNPVNVITLKRGDDLAAVLSSYAVEAPYQSQRSIAQLLSPYLDHSGRINLPLGHVIYLFEFGRIAPQFEASDFNDLIVLVSYRCHEPQDVLLRNSIGPNHYMTEGNLPFNTSELGSGYRVVIGEFAPTSDVKLKEFRLIVSQTSTSLNFSAYDYRVLVWSSLAAAVANPLNGDIASVDFDVPSAGPTPFGHTGPIPIFGVKPTWDVRFDLSGDQIIVPAGVGRYIAVYVQHGGGSNGQLGVLESTEDGVSDKLLIDENPGSYGDLVDSSFSNHAGRVGIELRGVTAN